MTVEPVTVVIADDNSAYRAGLAAAIGSAAELELIGQFADGPSALEGVDARMPGVGRGLACVTSCSTSSRGAPLQRLAARWRQASHSR